MATNRGKKKWSPSSLFSFFSSKPPVFKVQDGAITGINPGAVDEYATLIVKKKDVAQKNEKNESIPVEREVSAKRVTSTSSTEPFKAHEPKVSPEKELTVRENVDAGVIEETRAQIKELVSKFLATYPRENVVAVMNAAVKHFGQLECRQIINATAKSVALEKVTQEMADKVSPAVVRWLDDHLNSEVGGQKALRETLKSSAGPKVLEFIRQELLKVGPEILKEIILLHGDELAKEYVTKHIPTISATLLTNAVKKFAEENMETYGPEGIKDAIKDISPGIVAELLTAMAPLFVEEGVRKQVELQVVESVETSLLAIAPDVVEEVVRVEVNTQTPTAVALIVEKSEVAISEMVLKHAEANLATIVDRGIQLEIAKQAPDVVSKKLEIATLPLIEAGVQKQILLKVGPAVDKALKDNAKDIVVQAGSKAAEEKAPEVVDKMFKESKKVLSEKLIHFADVEASKQAVGVVSTEFAAMDIQKHLIPSLEFQSQQQSGAVVASLLLEVAPKIVEADVGVESRMQVEGAVTTAILNAKEALAKIVLTDIQELSKVKVDDIVIEEVKNSEITVREAVSREVKASATSHAERIVPDIVLESSRAQIPGIVATTANEAARAVVEPLLKEEMERKVASTVEEVLNTYPPEELRQRFDALMNIMLTQEVELRRVEVRENLRKSKIQEPETVVSETVVSETVVEEVIPVPPVPKKRVRKGFSLNSSQRQLAGLVAGGALLIFLILNGTSIFTPANQLSFGDGSAKSEKGASVGVIPPVSVSNIEFSTATTEAEADGDTTVAEENGDSAEACTECEETEDEEATEVAEDSDTESTEDS